jgi:hypothetical protein
VGKGVYKNARVVPTPIVVPHTANTGSSGIGLVAWVHQHSPSRVLAATPPDAKGSSSNGGARSRRQFEQQVGMRVMTVIEIPDDSVLHRKAMRP